MTIADDGAAHDFVLRTGHAIATIEAYAEGRLQRHRAAVVAALGSDGTTVRARQGQVIQLAEREPVEIGNSTIDMWQTWFVGDEACWCASTDLRASAWFVNIREPP